MIQRKVYGAMDFVGPTLSMSQDGQLIGIGCSDVLNDNEGIDNHNDKKNSEKEMNPILIDIPIQYEYEAYFVKDVEDKNVALAEVQRYTMMSLAARSGLLASLDKPVYESCMEMLQRIIPMNDLAKNDNGIYNMTNFLLPGHHWDYYLGWRAEPLDTINTDKEGCETQHFPSLPDGMTCAPVSGSIIAQVPSSLNIDTTTIEIQVLKHIRNEMFEHMIASKSIPLLNFIGIPGSAIADLGGIGEDGIFEKNIAGLGTNEGQNRKQNSNSNMSTLGLSLSISLIVAFLAIMLLFIKRIRNRRRHFTAQDSHDDDNDGDGDDDGKTPASDSNVEGNTLENAVSPSLKGNIGSMV
eukprot:CAMPEP_0184860100 /NCGR_PEP_ID=MMETSP0580-20130426/5050_1 /TAXON_ID=1118495 /ORGANISM="Dactyliosolen fragilissimus" /LENGTH=351 /DNA_ID=CAMNT_0027357075 /DNA_START=199 /DNA_END=1254 /DNA_ORIENTATION=-